MPDPGRKLPYLLSRAVLYPMASGLVKVVLLLWDKGNGFPMGSANNFRFDVSKLTSMRTILTRCWVVSHGPPIGSVVESLVAWY